MEPPIHFQGTSIGLVGCGRWGRFILRDLVALGCDTWTVVHSAESAENARTYGAHRIVESIAALPRDLAGYVVAVPTVHHAAVVQALLDRERPIFVEKPMTPDLASAQDLVRKAGERLFVMHKWRHHPGIEAMAAMIRNGTLGRLRMIKTRRNQWGLPHTDVDAVWILLPHDLSIVLHFLNALPEPVWAVGEQRAKDWFVSLAGQLGHDPAVFVEVSAHTPLKERGVVLSFEEGALMMADPLADHILLRRSDAGEMGAPVEKIPVSTEYPLLRELRAFVGHLHGGPPPYSSAEDGLRIVEMIARMRAMAQGGLR